MSDTSRSPTLTFLGGAGTVTGSKTLLDTAHGRLLVDCGLFQGPKHLRQQNWSEFPVPPGSIDIVVLTHAHIDHCGYLPRLVRAGFRGPVYCTEGTRKLAEIVLPDSGHLHEEEARHANKRGYSKHDPALPLYTRQEALDCLELLETVEFDQQRSVLPGIDADLASCRPHPGCRVDQTAPRRLRRRRRVQWRPGAVHPSPPAPTRRHRWRRRADQRIHLR